MKLYERIENNNFDEIDRNRAIELIEGGNGHLVYNENYFKLQKENEELSRENRKLRTIRYDTAYGVESIYLITKKDLVEINTNKYFIEIQDGKFVDLKQVYQENEELKADNYELNNRINDLLDNISVQKVKDKIEKYKKLSDKFYVKFLESDRYNTDIREKGIKCDAIILALEELIEEREEK